MRYLVSLLSLLMVGSAGADLRPFPLRGQESNLAEALESCGHVEPQVVSRGTAGFLAVWLQERHVVARRIDSAGFPEGEQIAVSPAPTPIGQALAARVVRLADGNFIVAWLQQATASRREIRFRRLAEDGTPVGGANLAISLGPTPSLGEPALAVLPDGSFTVVWSELDPTLGASTRLAFRGRRYDANEVAIGTIQTAASLPSTETGYPRTPQIAAVGLAGNVVVVGWIRPGDHSVFLALLGSGVTAPTPYYVGGVGQHEQQLGLAPVSGGFLMSWKFVEPEGAGVAVRRFNDADVAGFRTATILPPYARGGTFVIPNMIGVPTLAADVDGRRAVIQWLQTGESFDTEASFALMLNSDGEVFSEGLSSFRIDVPTLDTFGPQHHLTATQIAFAPAGRLAATWQVWRENPFLATSCDTGVAARIQTFELDEAPVVLPPDPPAGPYLTSLSVPGFRYKVRISGDFIGRSEAACLPQTGCVSGAVPGRSEVLIRVVGPRPNGRLWPTIVRFTTSQAEVWIEQTATGLRRYYLLPALDPNLPDLIGTIDRDGFPVP